MVSEELNLSELLIEESPSLCPVSLIKISLRKTQHIPPKEIGSVSLFKIISGFPHFRRGL